MLARNKPLKRGKGLKAGKGLKRGGKPLRRRTWLRSFNEALQAKRRERQFGAKAGWIRTFPCCVCYSEGCGPTEAHHVVTRARGGTAADLIPLGKRCHSQLHTIGIVTFAREREISLADLRDSYEALWQCLQRDGRK